MATIKADGGYEVRIVTDRYWEYQRSFYCELWRDGKKIKSAQFIELTDDPLNIRHDAETRSPGDGATYVGHLRADFRFDADGLAHYVPGGRRVFR